MEGRLLETVGAEIVAIVSPVSICMLLVVLLVHSLNPHGSNSPISSMAMLVYDEKSSDSAGEKFGGALLNALVFVAIVTVVTFLLVALFYFRCTKCLRAYMGFSAFTVLAYMGGALGVMLIQAWSIPIDVITFSIVLINFSVVGVLAVFFCRMPIVFTQGYLVLIGMLVAFFFTMLPEWTTWTLLMAMVVYDILAVLLPGGPLNMLVELAISRDEDIPALIYESRPMTSSRPPPSTLEFTSESNGETNPQRHTRRWNRRRTASNSGNAPAVPSAEGERLSVIDRLKSMVGPARVTENEAHHANFQLDAEIGLPSSGAAYTSHNSTSVTGGVLEIEIDDDAETRLQAPSSSTDHLSDDESAPLVRQEGLSSVFTEAPSVEAGPQRENIVRVVEEEEAEGIGLGASGGIKLGLGDFIFYSVLVGRAAMYDLMTVYACYLAIIAGLGATLVLLAVWRRALPALPFSISLGVLFYFLTRLLMEPFVVTLAADLVTF